MRGRFLVMGATGRQGGAVIEALLRHGRRPVAFVRDATSAAARRLAARGIELAVGSYDDPRTMERALAGVDAVFTMTVPTGGPEAEIARGKAMAKVLSASNVVHVVHSSVANADRRTGVAHFDAKLAVEDHLRQLGLPVTVVGPASLMENVIRPRSLADLALGRLMRPLPPDCRLAMIALADIGSFVALAFDRPTQFVGSRIDIAGDAPSGLEMAAVLSEVSGWTISYEEGELEVEGAVAEMYDWFARVGFEVDMEGLRQEYPEVAWTTFDRWTRMQDWPSLLRSV